jgi:hypothetical protein
MSQSIHHCVFEQATKTEKRESLEKQGPTSTFQLLQTQAPNASLTRPGLMKPPYWNSNSRMRCWSFRVDNGIIRSHTNCCGKRRFNVTEVLRASFRVSSQCRKIEEEAGRGGGCRRMSIHHIGILVYVVHIVIVFRPMEEYPRMVGFDASAFCPQRLFSHDFRAQV